MTFQYELRVLINKYTVRSFQPHAITVHVWKVWQLELLLSCTTFSTHVQRKQTIKFDTNIIIIAIGILIVCAKVRTSI